MMCGGDGDDEVNAEHPTENEKEADDGKDGEDGEDDANVEMKPWRSSLQQVAGPRGR